ncbi:MAG: hypothetical protein D6675_13500, partial [Gemmatimonadetes bacterium]
MKAIGTFLFVWCFFLVVPGGVSAVTYTSTDVPKSIGPNAGTITTSTITIADSAMITDVNVTINLNHTYDEDLEIKLINPYGVSIELSMQNGGSGNNYINTVFDDEAGTPITAGSPPFTGTYQPEGSLSLLDGWSIQGTWTLEITDVYNLDSGTLNSWSLDITQTTAPGLTGLNPPDNDLNSNKSTDLIINFDRAPVAQGGNISIYESGGVLFEQFPSTDARVTIAGTQVTINPADFDYTGYYVLIANSAFDDGSGNYFAGISDSTFWNFTFVGENSAADLPKPIGPDRGTVTTSTITVSNAGTLLDADVTISLTHSYDADLDIYLISPAGTRVELSTDNGGS